MVEVTKLQLIHAGVHHRGEEAPLEEGRGASRVQRDARSPRLPATGSVYPEITRMQARAIFERVRRHPGRDRVHPEVMILWSAWRGR